MKRGDGKMLHFNLRKIRKELRLTQNKLASRINYSQQAVAKWESGNSNPDMRNLIRLSNELKVTIDTLVREVPDAIDQKHCAVSIKRNLFHVVNNVSSHEELGVDLYSLDEADKLLLVDELFDCLVNSSVIARNTAE
ncbi:helix-turn-helix domain-containing protein [Erysipelothrix anatis]|uniref:helix-turn-helix domain-containing protein n=2 Tax=Erysipelotrichaceae TaxID=128827 RepID=UPI00135AEB6F|nr:helix-turn-helix transcriptional regulator [Erysipelothrix anatis]